MRSLLASLLAAVLAFPSAVLAQAAQNPPPAESVDVSKLGVDISRIKRELVQEDGASDPDAPVKLRFTVQVIGVAPKIDLLEGFPISGPLPYGAPTHQEILAALTPKAYSSPTVDFLGLAVIAAQKLFQYSKKQKCEAEIAEYRSLVMQGVPVSAPRCTQ